MHSSLIGKVEKANRYARELDRISIDSLSLTFRGDNDTHHVDLDAGQWHCTCHYFDSWGSCVHLLTLQKVMGVMLPEDAQVSIFSAGQPVEAVRVGLKPSAAPERPEGLTPGGLGQPGQGVIEVGCREGFAPAGEQRLDGSRPRQDRGFGCLVRVAHLRDNYIGDARRLGAQK